MKTTVTTYVAAGVGYSGEKTHSFSPTVTYDAMRGEVVTLWGSVYCGSRRAGSGIYLRSLDPSKIDCLKCAKHKRVDNEFSYETSGYTTRTLVITDASRVVQPGTGHKVVPTPWAAAEVTPVLSPEGAQYAQELRDEYAAQMRTYKAAGYQSPEGIAAWRAALAASDTLQKVVFGD